MSMPVQFETLYRAAKDAEVRMNRAQALVEAIAANPKSVAYDLMKAKEAADAARWAYEEAHIACMTWEP